ncbi:MAG: hypothetical protein Q9216_006196 [Gyalolechia sp. 2 TL-2023]
MDSIPSSPSRAANPGIELEDPLTVGYESPDEIDASNYQVSWTNVMEEGRYLSPSTYQKVEVLILCWAEHCRDIDTQEEVARFKAVLEKGFCYNVTVVDLDAKAKQKLQVQVNAKVAGFVENHDGPDTLLIVYYAGHGKPGEFFGDLELFGQTSPNDTRDTKKRARNRVVWNKTEELLRPAESDVLEIFDCCYAGQLGLTRGENRLFEFLAAAPSSGTTEVPGRASFTSALTFALESLRKEKPESRFTTDEVLRRIKTAEHFPTEQIPMLSDREHKGPGGGRIMLHPLRPEKKEIEKRNGPLAQWDGHVVTLHLEFGGGKPSEAQVVALGQHFNDLFERNALGVHRIRWGGMKRSTFGRAARKFRGNLRKRRASSNGWRANYRKCAAQSPSAVATKKMDLLSPQVSGFESQGSIDNESPKSILPSSVPTSDMEGELDTIMDQGYKPNKQQHWDTSSAVE